MIIKYENNIILEKFSFKKKLSIILWFAGIILWVYFVNLNPSSIELELGSDLDNEIGFDQIIE